LLADIAYLITFPIYPDKSFQTLRIQTPDHSVKYSYSSSRI